MSETYFKCSCRLCGGRIEFPSHAVGLSIGCPHCGATTDLYAPEVVSATAPPPLSQTVPPQRAVGSLVPQPPAGFGAGSRLQVATPPSPPPAATEDDLARQHA